MSDPTKGRGVMVCLYPKAGTCLWASSPPHLTLAFCGLVGETDVEEFSLLVAARRISEACRSITLRPVDLSVFGPPERPVRVVEFECTEALAFMRGVCDPFNRSEFRDFRPHMTLDVSEVLGELLEARFAASVTFDRVAVHYGDKRAVWGLL